MRFFWIRHPRSKKPDTMLTLAVYSTLAVIIKFALNGAVVNINGVALNFGITDAGLIGAVLAPTLGAYVARKWKDSPDAKAEVKDEASK